MQGRILILQSSDAMSYLFHSLTRKPFWWSLETSFYCSILNELKYVLLPWPIDSKYWLNQWGFWNNEMLQMQLQGKVNFNLTFG